VSKRPVRKTVIVAGVPVTVTVGHSVSVTVGPFDPAGRRRPADPRPLLRHGSRRRARRRRDLAGRPVPGPAVAGHARRSPAPSRRAGREEGTPVTALRPAGLAVVVLADGEAREAARDAVGSYDCPFCGNVTVSPQGWGDPQSYPRGCGTRRPAAAPAGLPGEHDSRAARRLARAAGQGSRTGGPAPAGIGADDRGQAGRRGKARGGAGAAHRAGRRRRPVPGLPGVLIPRGHQPRLVRHRDPANCPVSRGR
jgi:hypothetical protein